jgi:meso-butanediol dehydrogenase/(S,S)-butanediol dehydrogenase/diacetyl reductase
VNLTGVFLTARYAIPHLEAGGEASFVAVSSDAGIQGAAGFAAYCASKHGVIGLVKSLALDHGPRGVRCNAVCPGFVETPMAERIFADLPEQERERWRGTVPLGRFGLPEEVAEAIAHLSSPQASYVNGHTYVIDGGGTAGYFDS